MLPREAWDDVGAGFIAGALSGALLRSCACATAAVACAWSRAERRDATPELRAFECVRTVVVYGSTRAVSQLTFAKAATALGRAKIRLRFPGTLIPRRALESSWSTMSLVGW